MFVVTVSKIPTGNQRNPKRAKPAGRYDVSPSVADACQQRIWVRDAARHRDDVDETAALGRGDDRKGHIRDARKRSDRVSRTLVERSHLAGLEACLPGINRDHEDALSPEAKIASGQRSET